MEKNNHVSTEVVHKGNNKLTTTTIISNLQNSVKWPLPCFIKKYNTSKKHLFKNVHFT